MADEKDYLDFFAYSLKKLDGDESIRTQQDVLRELASMGFESVQPVLITSSSLDTEQTIAEAITHCSKMEIERDSWAYETDGVVLKVLHLVLLINCLGYLISVRLMIFLSRIN
jgi:NAD-dependent DNA ligase